MKIEHIRTLAGPNIHTHVPVLLMVLDLEELTETESYEIPGFVDRLLTLLPGIHEHHCAKDEAGGFVERLHTGTYFGHIVEHVALELSKLAGIPAYYGKTRYAGTPGTYNVVVEYRETEHGMRYLLRTAVALVDALVAGDSFPLDERLDEARRMIARTSLGPSTRAIVEAAERRGIPYRRLNDRSLVQLGYGIHRKHLEATICDQTRTIAVDIVADKALTKTLLEEAAIPVPRSRTVQTADEAIAALDEIVPPVVVKPLDGRQGQGVSLNLTSAEEVATAFELAREFSEHVLVEEYVAGDNYRVLVIDGTMVAASRRLPAHVVGDGKHSIGELIEHVNEDPRRGEGHEKPLTKITIDPILLAHIEKAGYSLDTVPAEGETVFLREGANLSTGGTASDVTDDVHPDVVRLCERAARVIGLDVCGLDLVAADIARPIADGGGAIIELNAAPGIRMHLFPSEGQQRAVGEAIVDMLYPSHACSRIPIISVTGTNGKTTTTRMIGHIFASTGHTVGMTTTDGIFIDGERIVEGDTTGPRSAQTVLADPIVEVAVLETARGGLARSGLGYDWADVGVFTNIQPDHIGQDGIESVEDLVHIKSLVAERIREGGTLVLNADDEHVAAIAERPRVQKVPKDIIYFSLVPNNPYVMRHLANAGRVYLLKDGWIVEAVGGMEWPVIQAADIPATMSGTAKFHVANALAAVAAAAACGMSHRAIASALTDFGDGSQNAGRTNLYRVNGGYVLVDYAHNPHAFAAIARMASQWCADGRRLTGIIGVPGDRADELIEQAGRVAARNFHKLVIKEDQDLRGRAQGEVARLLYRAARAEAPGTECRIVLDEVEALSQALHKMEAGEIIVLFYEKQKSVLAMLEEWDAVPVTAPTDAYSAGSQALVNARVSRFR